MFTIDTNILIYYALGDKATNSFLLEQIEKKVPLIIPTIVVAEFLSFPALNPAEQKIFSKLLKGLQIYSLTFDIAKQAGHLRKKYKILLADAVIAATAQQTKSILITRNLKHFQKIKEITVQSI